MPFAATWMALEIIILSKVSQKEKDKYHSSVQSLSRVRLFATPWTAACQASLSITNSWSLLKLMSIESVMPSNHLIILCVPFSSHLQSFPALESFLMSQFFTSGSLTSQISKPLQNRLTIWTVRESYTM